MPKISVSKFSRYSYERSFTNPIFVVETHEAVVISAVAAAAVGAVLTETEMVEASTAIDEAVAGKKTIKVLLKIIIIIVYQFLQRSIF